MHWAALLAVLPLIAAAPAPAVRKQPRDVDTTYPYTGPEVPIGDLMDQTIEGNGKGFIRVREPPAVTPAPGITVTNNINVISTALLNGGIQIHFQTPFGIGNDPKVLYGTSPTKLNKSASGTTNTYDRTPPCSMADPTQCSQFFHEVRLTKLSAGQTYYYQIPGGNGTTPSDVLSFTVAPKAGDKGEFTVAIIADMGYTNARGTHERLIDAAQDGAKFVWHGGDTSYADQWYAGILPCEDSWDLCYNGSSSRFPGGTIDETDYYIPVPEGEVASQGSPWGGDISAIYETNWDLWQQWMNSITKHIPYMIAPGNHEAACAEFDGPNNELSAYLDDDQPVGSHKANKTITYYSCPPSQRNFTAYTHRFGMPGDASGGVGNFWYSFDYGQAHFITFDGETDYYQSPEWPFVAELKAGQTSPLKNQTFITDSGPFGRIDGMAYKDNKAYEQYQWLLNDLKKVDRKKTPWVFAQSHRPFWSSEVSSYQAKIRAAYEDLFLEYGVDAYFSGHIHWYERLWPLGKNGTVQHDAIVNNNTYTVKTGTVAHIINGAAGNIESHSELGDGVSTLPITAVLNTVDYGINKLTVYNESTSLVEFVRGSDGSVADFVWLKKAGKK